MFNNKMFFSNFVIVAIYIAFSGPVTADQASLDIKPELAKTVGQMLLIDAAVANKFEEDRLLSVMGKKNNNSEKLGAVPMKTAPIMQPIGATDTTTTTTPIIKPAEIKTLPPMLLGIFGIGNNLYTDVQIDSERVRYQSGHLNPVSGNPKTSYKLVNISVPCITLMKNKTSVLICLEKDGI